MPRIPRGQVAGHVYHVLNRGNGGARVFHKDGDYTAFLDLLATAKANYPVKIFSVCLMPNHFHMENRQRVTAEFKHDAIRLWKSPGRSARGGSHEVCLNV